MPNLEEVDWTSSASSALVALKLPMRHTLTALSIYQCIPQSLLLWPRRERKSLKSAKQIFVQPLVIPLPFIYAKFHLLFIFHAWTSARKQNTKKNIFGFRVGTRRLVFCAERKSRRSWGRSVLRNRTAVLPIAQMHLYKAKPTSLPGPIGSFWDKWEILLANRHILFCN